MSQSRKQVVPTRLTYNNFERVVSTKNREFFKERVLTEFITKDGYEDSLIVDCRLMDKKLFEIRNMAAVNGLHYKVLACVEDDAWHEIKVETAVAAGGKAYEWATEPWAYVKIQVKSQLAGNAAMTTAFIVCQS